MNKPLHFKTRDKSHVWLINHYMPDDGIWLKFEKSKNTAFRAGDTLEEALCFGWIDGVTKRIDDESYIKYFPARRKGSKWSEENRALAENLEKHGLVTSFRRKKVQEARRNGQWGKPSGPPTVTTEQIGTVVGLLRKHEPAYTNFQKMPPSVQRTYTRAYYDTRTDDRRARRFAWMVERLEKNLKPI